MEVLWQLLANALATAGIYVLMGVGLSIIYRVSRVFHFAHGSVYTVAAYVLFVLSVRLGVPLPVALLVAVGLSASVGYGIDICLYRPLARRRVSGAALLIASLGTYILLENIVAAVFGTDTQILLPGVQKTLQFGGASVTWPQLAQILLLVLLTCGAFLIRRKPLGLWLRSVANDPAMSSALGLRVGRIRALAFLIGSGLAGLAACLVAMNSGAEPHMGIKALFVAIVAVFVGGPDMFLGPILGGLLFSILQVGANYTLSSRWESSVAFVVLLLFMVFRPEGILSRTRRVEEMAAH